MRMRACTIADCIEPLQLRNPVDYCVHHHWLHSFTQIWLPSISVLNYKRSQRNIIALKSMHANTNTHMHTQTHTQTRTKTRTHKNTHTHTNTCTHTNTHTHICMHAQLLSPVLSWLHTNLSPLRLFLTSLATHARTLASFLLGPLLTVLVSLLSVIHTLKMAEKKEKKNYAGSKTLPASIKERDTLARSAVSLPHQRKKKTIGDL